MLIIQVIFSILQIAAITYLYIVSSDLIRTFTLAKNPTWVKEFTDFKLKYVKPPRWPFVGYGIVISAIIIYFAIHEATWVIWCKIFGMLGTLVIALIYGLIERNIKRKIPISPERHASLLPNTLDCYISKNLSWISYTSIVLLAVAYLVSFLAEKITLSIFAGDIACQILVQGISLISILLIVREKVPHKKMLTLEYNEDLGKLYKVILIKIFSLFIVGYTLLSLSELAMQWNGYEFPSPLANGWYRLFNEASPSAIMDQSIWDIIASALSIPLLVYLANNKVFRSIRSVNFSINRKIIL